MSKARPPRVVADPEVCIGAGTCVMVAPGVFDQDADELTVVLLSEEVSAEDLAAVRQAVSQCPSRAIALEGGE